MFYGLSWAGRYLKRALEIFRRTGEKKTLCKYGKIDINKNHVYNMGAEGYQISPYMQEKMVYVAQMNCYEESSQVLEMFLGIPVSTMQIHRVANTYGALIEQQKVGRLTEVEQKQLPSLGADEVVYAQADGSMILTREEGWKEVKVGRIFKSSDCVSMGNSQQRGWIKASNYEAYLGDHRQFTNRFENELDSYSMLAQRLIFISDGATWIRNWITGSYPQATQILDWYHCREHLCHFAELYFGDTTKKQTWISEQTHLLYASHTEQVIQNIRSLKTHHAEKTKAKKQLIDYYQNNLDRMDYSSYRNMGAGIIGSGAIEAAHRNVIQKRMKLSGQRWSTRGAQNILHLRVCNLSGKWHQILHLIKTPVKKVA